MAKSHRNTATNIKAGFVDDEDPETGATVPEDGRNKKSNVGTVSYLPTVFGCICAQAVITNLAD